MEKKHVLLGIRDGAFRDMILALYDHRRKYVFDCVESSKGMLERMDGRKYDYILMDATLDRDKVFNVSCAKEVYRRVNKGHFMALTNEYGVLQNAQNLGIPIEMVRNFDVIEFFEREQNK